MLHNFADTASGGYAPAVSGGCVKTFWEFFVKMGNFLWNPTFTMLGDLSFASSIGTRFRCQPGGICRFPKSFNTLVSGGVLNLFGDFPSVFPLF